MAQFVTGSFNTMDPRMFNPIPAAIQSALGRQNIQQQGIETSFLPQLLKAQLEQQQQLSAQSQARTQAMPQLLRAEASRLSPKGVIAQYLAQQAQQSPGLIQKTGHAIGSGWDWLTGVHPSSAQPMMADSPSVAASPGDMAGFVPVKVKGKTVMYNPVTQQFKAG